jgi:D-3-phosphoglycerate dehydrogenase
MDETILNKFPQLKFIITPTTGLNHIDLDFAHKKNIEVLSLKGETEFLNSISSTAEHTWALIMATQRKLIPAVKHTTEYGWNRNLFKGYNLRGKTLGIVGLGRVGKQVATFAQAFGMQVMYYDPFETALTHLGTKVEDIKSLFSGADVISIHIPLEKETVQYIDASLIRLMKKSASIINTSRGEIWDELAIADALKNKKISAVATDVLGNEFDEKTIKQNPLMKLQSEEYPIIITPHIAGATYDSMHATELFMAKKFHNQITNN